MITKEQIISKFLKSPKYLKNGAGFLAKSWCCDRELVYEARDKARELIHSGEKVELNNHISALEEQITKVNNEKGTLESTVDSTFEPRNDAELAELHKIDTTKYKISTYWSKLKSNGKFTSSVLCTLIKVTAEDTFQEEFKTFLAGYKPGPKVVRFKVDANKPKISLIFPKQDAHFNKFDIDGKNSIEDRFSINKSSISNMLSKATATNHLEEVLYIVGSDQFNAEWTGMTTKFTPQQNILTYQEAFRCICDHEVDVVSTLLANSDRVKIVFIPGNHDQYAGWHLVDWLEAWFKNNERVSFDSRVDNTKYHKYNNTAIMLNHGDDIKPKDMAQKFPMGFKDQWSSCKHFYIFTGDKHHEMSLDISGIKFYQVPQLSGAKSGWDDKKGFTVSSPEQTAFVITSNNGMSDIYKDIL
jgi:hypothetical protein